MKIKILFVILVLTLLIIAERINAPETTPTMIAHAQSYATNRNLGDDLLPFTQDGCTLFPDRIFGHDLSAACFAHDIQYWAGGTPAERKAADIAFKEAIAHTGSLGPTIGLIAYSGVRVFGDSFITRACNAHWGYGRK